MSVRTGVDENEAGAVSETRILLKRDDAAGIG
jgi:hypothetical protein